MSEQSTAFRYVRRSVSLRTRVPGWVLGASLTVLVCGFLLVVATVGTANGTEAPGALGLALLLGLAVLVIGILTGFVFGVPRALQQARQIKEENGANPRVTYAPNTNLEQISDWLTKILVGVGLIQLGSIGAGLDHLINRLGPALANDPAGRLLAGVEIAFFGPVGFLLGYLLTRTYLTLAFNYFDHLSETMVSAVARYAARLGAAAQQLFSVPLDYTPRSDESRVSPVHNREPLEKIVKSPPSKVRDLHEFRNEMGSLLDTLIGHSSRHVDSIKDKIDILANRGVLDRVSSRALHDLVVVTDLATDGTALPVDSDPTLGESVHKILNQLTELQKLTARKFEYHIIDTLVRNSPRDWSIQLDAGIIGGAFVSEAASRRQAQHVSGRVDALVTDSHGQSTVVEVRSRVKSTSDEQLQSLKTWISGIPRDVPVVVIIPDDAVRDEHLDDDRAGHIGTAGQDRGGQVHVLDWDAESNRLISVIHETFVAREGPREWSREWPVSHPWPSAATRDENRVGPG